MKSRTVCTCETILKALIRKYGPFAKIGLPLIQKAVIEKAGGDSRTLKRYCEQLVLLDFVKLQRDGTYCLNWKKVDYAQMSLQESLVVEKEEEPP